ncbi:hypothetical protein FRC04_002512 [Tulasnella sp. 424]|nr:hypothetical protein FRC04_002512 [Tulasnella sp. 424]
MNTVPQPDSQPLVTPQHLIPVEHHVPPGLSDLSSEPQTKMLSKNAKRKLRRKQSDAIAGSLTKLAPKPRPTPAPEKKKSSHKRSAEAKARRLGRGIRKWMIKLPSQNGLSLEIPAATLDLFDGQERPTTAMVATSLAGWSLDTKTYTEAPAEGIFLLRRAASDLDNFDDDPDDLGAPLPANHHSSNHLQVSSDGIFLSQDLDAGAGCGPLDPPCDKVSTPRLFEPDFALIRYQPNLSLGDEARLIEAVAALQQELTGGDICHDGRTKSWHVGPWSKYRHVPRMASTVFHQSDTAKIALNNFAGLLTELVVKPVAAMISELDPLYYRLATRANMYVHLACKESDPLTSNLMWTPLFNVGELRWSVNDPAHLTSDPAELYAFLLTTERFEGKRLCFPHIRLAVPFGPFTVILVQARKLVHFSEQTNGSHFIFTGFVDYNTALQAGIRCKEFLELSDEEFMIWIKERIKVQWAKEEATGEARVTGVGSGTTT